MPRKSPSQRLRSELHTGPELTEISFHFNTPDKLSYACRLLRKAVNGGSKVVVTASAETLGQLDTLLWTISPLDFIAHCRGDGDTALLAASPVLLGLPVAMPSNFPVLLNLGDPVPDGFERFERLVELVSGGDDDRAHARDRWKYYAHRGYEITRHDVAAKPPLDASA